MQEPRITVIIPTRERRDVLAKALQTVTDQDYENLEIIVSDNFSGDETEELVRGIPDSRVRYLNTGRRLSMSHNWEFALSHVSSGWATIIGDDDGLLPDSVSRVAEIIRFGEALAIRSRVCTYYWPDAIGRGYGRLSVPLQSGSETRSTRIWLANVLRGRAAYPELPMLYNGGYVEISVLNRIKERTGSYYRSCIPDVYSAVSIASALDRYIYCNEPLAINGGSRHSTGISQFNGTNDADTSPEQRFRMEGNIPFHSEIPLCEDGRYPPSLHAMVFESYLQTQDMRAAQPGIHAQQLELILATAGRHEEAILEWGKRFAALHDLNFPAIALRARVARPRMRFEAFRKRASSLIAAHMVGSPDLTIRDVHEASHVAKAILDARPGKLENLRQLARQAIQKIRPD